MTDSPDETSLPDDLERQIDGFDALPATERAQALDALLAAHPRHAEMIEAIAMLRSMKLDACPAPSRIGPYRIGRVLGEGGMGTVYLAEQEHPVRRRTAIKLIKLGMDSKQVIARFEAERQALALMEHSSIAKVFDGGLTEDGRPYFVMEYVDGVPITRYCDEQGLGLAQRLVLIQQVCSGVQHAHQKGIIHRDLKPSNVLVTVEDGEPRPKIIDFSLARAVDRQDVGATLLTLQGQFLGTPAYVSPEQAGATTPDLDTRTDVYSLGVVLYELLVGALPFDTDELLALGFAEMQHLIRDVDPPRPSMRITRSSASGDSRRSWASSLRGDLDWIVMKALAKEPDRRYHSPSSLADDIGRFLAHEPIEARPPGSAYRLRRFMRRHRLAVGAGIVVSAALIAGTVVSTSFAIQADAHLSEFNHLSTVVRLREAKAREQDFDPAWPDQVDAITAWLDGDAKDLEDALPGLRETLGALRGTALPWSVEDQAADRKAHPRYRDQLRLRRKISALRYVDDVRRGLRAPGPFEFDQTELPRRQATILGRITKQVGPHKDEHGNEAQALAILRHVRESGMPGNLGDNMLREILTAWANLENGLDEAALTAIDRGIEVANNPRRKAGMRKHRRMLEARIAHAKDHEAVEQDFAKLEAEDAVLKQAVSTRQTYRFTENGDRFLHDTIVGVIDEIERFIVTELPRSRERLRWAERYAEPHAERWQAAREFVARHYEDIGELRHQHGLVPIGVNPSSGHLEFYDLRSAANPEVIPSHQADGLIAMDGDRGMVFVLIPGEGRVMGSQDKDPDEPFYVEACRADETRCAILLKPFLISRYEMTQGQWSRLNRGDRPSRFDTDLSHPVELVSWLDCSRLLKQFRMLLPTEAQWEYACRVKLSTPWFTGADAASLNGSANLADLAAKRGGLDWAIESDLDDGHVHHAPVGTFTPNAFGLHDTHGNVHEWCRDTYLGKAASLRPGDGLRRSGDGPRTFRGGSYADTAEDARSARRHRHEPTVALPNLGLRPIRRLLR